MVSLSMSIATIEIIMLIIALSLLVCFIYTLFHTISNKSLTNTQRTIWILLVVFTSVLGWIAYWWYGKNGTNKIVS